MAEVCRNNDHDDITQMLRPLLNDSHRHAEAELWQLQFRWLESAVGGNALSVTVAVRIDLFSGGGGVLALAATVAIV